MKLHLPALLRKSILRLLLLPALFSVSTSASLAAVSSSITEWTNKTDPESTTVFTATTFTHDGSGSGETAVGSAEAAIDTANNNILFQAAHDDDVFNITSWNATNDLPYIGETKHIVKNSCMIVVHNGEVVLNKLGNLGDAKTSLSIGTAFGHSGTLTLSGGTCLEASGYYNTIGSINASGTVNVTGEGTILKTQQMTLGSVTGMESGPETYTYTTEENGQTVTHTASTWVHNMTSSSAERDALLSAGGAYTATNSCGTINVTDGGTVVVGENNTDMSRNKLQIRNGSILVDGAGSRFIYETNGTGGLTLQPGIKITGSYPDTTTASINVTNGGSFTANICYASLGSNQYGNFAGSEARLYANGQDSTISIVTAEEISLAYASPGLDPYKSRHTENVAASVLAEDGASISLKAATIDASSCALEDITTSTEMTARGEGSSLLLSANTITFGSASSELDSVTMQAEDGGSLAISGGISNNATTSISADNADISLNSYADKTGSTAVSLTNGSTLLVGTPGASPSEFNGATVSIDSTSRLVAGGDVTFTDSVINVSMENASTPAIVVEEGSVLNWGTGSAPNTIHLTVNQLALAGNSTTQEVVVVMGDTNYGDGGAANLKVITESALIDGELSTPTQDGAQLLIPITLNGQAQALARQAFSAAGMGVANALHSSVASVQGLGHAALRQMTYRPATDSRFWVQGLGDFMRAGSSGNAPGYHYNGGGCAVGYDRAVTDSFVVGAALGQQFGVNKTRLENTRVRQAATMGTIYGRYAYNCPRGCVTRLIDGYASYGQVRNRARSVMLGEGASGRWNDDVFNVGLRMGWQIPFSEQRNWTLTPFMGIEYAYGSQGAAHFVSASYDRRYHDGSMQVWSLPLGATLQGRYAVSANRYLLPELTLAYVGDISRRNPGVKAPVLGRETLYKGTDPGRNALRMQVGSRYTLTEHTTLGLFYGLEYRARSCEQSVNASVSISF